MKSARSVIGEKFGRWQILNFSHTNIKGKYKYHYWNCLCDCGQKRAVEVTSLKKGNSISCGCFKREMSPKGEKHYFWKGDAAGYHAIHAWLRKHFGKADRCENPFCRGESHRFEWAKLKQKEYQRVRENYIRLCHSCHFLYDMTPEWKEKSLKGLRKRWKI